MSSRERLHPAPDLELVPKRSVLIQHEDRLAGCVSARRDARSVQLHQGHEPVSFGLVRRYGSEHAAKAKRLIAELGTLPLLARRRRIALVENEVDDLKDRGEPSRKLLAAWCLVSQPRFRKSSLCAHDALSDCPIRQEERPRDLLRR